MAPGAAIMWVGGALAAVAASSSLSELFKPREQLGVVTSVSGSAEIRAPDRLKCRFLRDCSGEPAIAGSVLAVRDELRVGPGGSATVALAQERIQVRLSGGSGFQPIAAEEAYFSGQVRVDSQAGVPFHLRSLDGLGARVVETDASSFVARSSAATGRKLEIEVLEGSVRYGFAREMPMPVPPPAEVRAGFVARMGGAMWTKERPFGTYEWIVTPR